MAPNELSVSEQVQGLLASWNPPPEDKALERLVGVPTEPGDTRATAHVPMEELNGPHNPARDSVDAQRQYADDLDDPSFSQPDYDDVTVAELKERLEAAGKPVSGSKRDLYDRLYEEADEEDDESDE
jgi:hypothetical protein